MLEKEYISMTLTCLARYGSQLAACSYSLSLSNNAYDLVWKTYQTLYAHVYIVSYI